MSSDEGFPVPAERIEAFLRAFYDGPDLHPGALDRIIASTRVDGVWERAAKALQYVGCWAHDDGGLCPCYRNGLSHSHSEDGDVVGYLRVTHKHLQLHDRMGAGLTCDGCRILSEIDGAS